MPRKKKPPKAEKLDESQKTTNPMSRRWTFTLFPEQLEGDIRIERSKASQDSDEPGDISDINYDDFEALLWESVTNLRGCFYSLEKGDSKEHLHVQGYFELSKPVRWKWLAEHIGHGVHLEKAKGTRDDNLDYIFHRGQHKDKGELVRAVSFGTFPSHVGDERNCYDEAVSMLLEGVSIPEILAIYKGAMLQHVNNLMRLEELMERSSYSRLRILQEEERVLREMRQHNLGADVPY